MTDLRIAPGLTLDADYVGGGTFALLAKKGAGKTYTGRVMAEEFWKAKVPFVALDPMDAWWGLRSSADGEGEGIPVAIFGGPHGDAPLERTGGKLMADLVVEEGLSMVLCLKDLGSRAAERQFALDFLDRLYRTNRDLVHLLIDEADLFAPQKPQSGDQPLLGVTENIVRRGRNNGIGITLITQRPAVLNKDVLTQVDGLVAMRITGYTDREAIDDWVRGHADQELASKVKPTLSGLANGACWWWVPELDVLQRVQVRQSHTFDSSPTRTRGARQREPKSFADVDMDSIEERMAATIERAKADDPKELRRQVAELKKQLADRPAETVVETQIEERVVEVPAIADVHLRLIEEAAVTARAVASTLTAAADQVAEGLRTVAGARAGRTERGSAAVKPRPTGAPVVAAPARPPARRPAPAPSAEGDLSAYARGLLETVAQRHPMRPTRSQIATLSGRKPRSSAFAAAMAELTREGMLSQTGSQYEITDAGLTTVGADIGPPLTPDEVIAHWRGVLPAYERSLFDELVNAHPNGLTRQELSDRTGRSITSSAFAAAISTLAKNGVASTGSGEVRASDDLFLAVTA